MITYVYSCSHNVAAAVGSPIYILKEPSKNFWMTLENSLVQFPNPYTVPVHFSRDVTECLTTGKMTKDTQNRFLSAVASHVFQIKKNPSTEDMINISQAIITKYPFMRSPTGSPYVSIPLYVCNTMQD